MNRRNIMPTAVIILGIMLAGITDILCGAPPITQIREGGGYRLLQGQRTDMECPADQNPVQAEGRPEDGDNLHGSQAERTLGQRRAMGPCV